MGTHGEVSEKMRKSMHAKKMTPVVIDESQDDMELWLAEELRRDPQLEGAIEDASVRANLVCRLVSYRRETGLRQSAIAKAMETTQSAVSELEGGNTDPRLSTLQRYARALDRAIRISVDPALPSTASHDYSSDTYVSIREHPVMILKLPMEPPMTRYTEYEYNVPVRAREAALELPAAS